MDNRRRANVASWRRCWPCSEPALLLRMPAPTARRSFSPIRWRRMTRSEICPRRPNNGVRPKKRLKADYIPRADPSFVSSQRAQEARLAAKVEMMAPKRWQAILEALIQHGADYDVFAATALGDTNRARRLLSADNSVFRARDCNGQTPLHWAVQTDRLPMASFWIAAGAPLDVTNDAGQTALHLAAVAGKVEFVKTLLAIKASTSIRDTNGWTPLDAALQAKQADCIHLLLPENPGAHPERGLSTPLHQAAATGNVAALAALLETRATLEARDELGLTPLQVAVQNGHLAAAALLVDKGANVNARDPDGNTLLHQTIPRSLNSFVRDRRQQTGWNVWATIRARDLPEIPHRRPKRTRPARNHADRQLSAGLRD